MDNELIKVPLYTEREKFTDFEMYIYGTKNANEQKQDFFGKALKRYANDIGVNATELAKLTGISKSAVNYYFNGERQVGFNTLIELCLALKLHPLRTEYLFELTHFELRRFDPRYYVIKEYISGCAYKEKFNLHNYQMRLQKYNFLVSDEREKVTDFETYIYGTKNAEEQKRDFFGKALKRYADDNGVSMSKLARLTEVSKVAVNYYFSGERQVGFNMLIALCLALRLHPLRTEYIFEFTHFELRKSDPRYYIIKEYLSGCAYEEKFNLHACQMRLKELNLELLISDRKGGM